MYALYNLLKEEKICLSYLGAFDDAITDKLTEISEDYLESSNKLGKLKNKVSFLIAESFQNVVRHGIEHSVEKAEIENHKDFFQINAFADRVVLSSSNLITKDETVYLEKNISKINSLSIDELRDLYSDVLENKGFSKKGGAGLGLIEMARKSGLPIKYHFNAIDSTHYQFFLALEIINKDESPLPRVSITTIVDFYKMLLKKDCLVFYKGDMSREVLLPLVEILKTNFMADGVFSKEERRSVETLIEIIKNVTKHGKIIENVRPGIFMINEDKNSFIVECGNFIEKENLASFKRNLLSTKEMSSEQINAHYLQAKEANLLKSPKDRGATGLLEMARNCSNNFTYDFIETNDNEVFFSISIHL